MFKPYKITWHYRRTNVADPFLISTDFAPASFFFNLNDDFTVAFLVTLVMP